MSTTPNYNWPLIENTDFVTNLPADLEALADDIDSTVYSLDQDNVKITEFVAKGDLLSASAENTPARLGVGANGTVLIADSGETTGLKWAAVGGGSSFTLLNTGGTSLSGNNTVTVSGINHEKLVIFITGTRMTNASSAITVRFNTDTGTNYARVFTRTTAGSTYAATNFSTTGNINATSFQVLTSSSNTDSVCEFSLSLVGGKSTGAKAVSYIGGADASGGNGQILVSGQGLYLGTSAISSVSVISGGGNFTLGTLYVYGSSN